MSSYLKVKLRRLVGKRQEDLAYSRYLGSTIDSGDFHNRSNVSQGPIDQFYSAVRGGSRLKV